MPSRNTGARKGATPAGRRSETVTFGTTHAGTINETARGFEIFDADGKYLFTQPSMQSARKALFERHVAVRSAA